MQNTLEVTRALALAELKELANAAKPCVTFYIPLEPAANTSRIDGLRLKSLVQQAERQLTGSWPELSKTQVRDLMGPLQSLDAENVQRGNGGSLVVLRSPDTFRAFEVRKELDDTVVIGESFHVFPLIHSLNVAGQMFYLLALSQKHIRLLRCTPVNSELVPLPEGSPTSLVEWLNTRSPNQPPERVAASPSPEGRTEGNFTSATDRDNKGPHLANFFRAVNHAVADLLRNQTAPLILCGVEHERAIYRQNNTYPSLLEPGVQGSPESLKGGEMHARALELVQEHFAGPARKALELWEKLGGGTRVVTAFADVVKAAFEGRIAHLFAVEGAQTMGVFDRATMQMRIQGRQEDLVNAASLQTLAFGGEVFILKPEDMPGRGQLSAILRF